MRGFLLIFTFVLALSIPVSALAAAPKKDKKNKASNQFQANWAIEEEVVAKAEGVVGKASQAVDLPMVILPIFDQYSLSNYVFLAVRLNLNEGQDAWPIREKSHFLSDALIRKSHNAATGLVASSEAIDMEQLQTLVQLAVEPWVTKDRVNSIEFTRMDLQQ